MTMKLVYCFYFTNYIKKYAQKPGVGTLAYSRLFLNCFFDKYVYARQQVFQCLNKWPKYNKTE